MSKKMDKRLLLTAALAVTIGASETHAHSPLAIPVIAATNDDGDGATDVTAQYLTNANFEGSYSVFTNPSSDRALYQPEGWTVTRTGSDASDLSALKSGDLQDNNFKDFASFADPASANHGAQSYWARLRWGSNTGLALSQDVTLPKGWYRLSADVQQYVGTQKDNNAEIFAGGNIAKIAASSNKADNWANRAVVFYSDGETATTMGFRLNHVTQGNNNNNGEQIVGVDNFKLESLGNSFSQANPTPNLVANGEFGDGGASVKAWTQTLGYQNFQEKQMGTKDSEPIGTFTGVNLEAWNRSAKAGKVYYTLSQLPQGRYTLKIAAFASGQKEGDQNVYIFADEGKTYVTSSTPSDYEVSTLFAGGDLQIGIAQAGASSQWLGIDNVELYYNGLSQDDETTLISQATASSKAAAQAALDKYADYTGEERAALEKLMSNPPTTLDGVSGYKEQINQAITSFSYAAEEAIALAGEHGDYIKSYRTLKAKYTNDISSMLGDIASWEGNMVANNGGQHWSGQTKTYWEQTGAMWGQNAWTISKKTSVTLPKGQYALVVAGRTAAEVEGYVKVGDQSVALPKNGDTGLGIDINGNASYNPLDKFANNNAGRGWEWRTIEFEVTEASQTVDIEFGGATSASHQWMSVADVTLLSDPASAARANFTQAITAAEAALPTVNIGEKPFQVAQDKVNKFNEIISQAKALDSNAATTDELEAATTKLNDATALYGRTTVELNKPADGQLFNIIIKGNNGYQYDGKALTFKPGTTAGGYAMGYTEDAGSFYTQAVTLVPVEGKTNEYHIAFNKADGTQVYVGTGSLYNGYDAQLRATTDASKAVGIKVEMTSTEGLYNLRNMANELLISANGEKDAGFFTGNKQWNNFNLVDAAKNSVSLKVSEHKWATFIAPFDVQLPEGVKAYTCDAVDNNSLTLTEVTENLKANTPYVLYADDATEQTVEGYAVAEAATYTTGLLTGVYVTNENLPKNARNYVLQYHEEGGLAFYSVNDDNVRCVANRAYLTVPEEAAEAKSFSLGTGDATAISGLLDNGAQEVERYNAAGIKLSAPAKGLNIVKLSNGKTVKQIIK